MVRVIIWWYGGIADVGNPLVGKGQGQRSWVQGQMLQTTKPQV